MTRSKLLCCFLFIPFLLNAQQPVTITEGHRNSYPSVKSKFTYTALGGKQSASASGVSAAKAEVARFNIVLSADGLDVSGTAISKNDLLSGAKLVAWSENINNLALASKAGTPDTAANEDLIKFVKHLLKYWQINNCKQQDISGRNYTFYWETWKGWICALPVLQDYDSSHAGSELAREALHFIKQVYKYNSIHENPYNVNDLSYSTGDFIYTNTRFLFCMAAFNPTVDEQIADYIRIQRLYENYAKPRDGGIYWGSGIWIDGTFMHHGSVHSSYQYQLRQWIDDMWKMKDTSFEISLDAYNHITKAVYTLYLECTDGKALGYTIGGRSPLGSVHNWMLARSYFVKLIKLGGALKGDQEYDPVMAAKYNYLTNTTTFPVHAENLDGFYQLNYAGMGLYRGRNNTNRWVATMRGLTSNNWGAEFINGQNTFGRYQAHGVLEILYAADHVKAASGYPDTPEWDWNVIPGTTTVHHWPDPWYSIQVINSSSFAWQKKRFVGALSNGKSGIFAMDYEEDPRNGGWGTSFTVIDNLKFRKSVFSHNNLMVCLGSDIQSAPTSNRPTDTICSNLFQFVYNPEVTSRGLYLNNSSSINSDIDQKTSLSDGNWIISPAGTGFHIPSQAGALRLIKGTQSVPAHNVYPRNSSATEDTYAHKMVSQSVAKAWIAHNRTKSSYEYVVVPGTTPADMQSRVVNFGSGKGIYSILQQDSVAHVIHFTEDNTSCYAVFQASSALPAPLVSASKPCLLLIKPAGDSINISICTPDLNPISDASRPKGWLAGLSVISFSIEGIWQLSGASNNVAVKNMDATSTTIEVDLQHGLNESFKLIPKATSIKPMQKNESQLKVFPNPCESALYVHDDLFSYNEWKIIDISGRTIKMSKSSINGRIDVSSLNPGTYLLVIHSPSTSEVKSAVFVKK